MIFFNMIFLILFNIFNMFYIYKIKLKMENSSFKYLIYKEYYKFLYMIFNK